MNPKITPQNDVHRYNNNTHASSKSMHCWNPLCKGFILSHFGRACCVGKHPESRTNFMMNVILWRKDRSEWQTMRPLVDTREMTSSKLAGRSNSIEEIEQKRRERGVFMWYLDTCVGFCYLLAQTQTVKGVSKYRACVQFVSEFPSSQCLHYQPHDPSSFSVPYCRTSFIVGCYTYNMIRGQSAITLVSIHTYDVQTEILTESVI